MYFTKMDILDNHDYIDMNILELLVFLYFATKIRYAGRGVFSLILIYGCTSKIEFNCNACGKNFQMR